MRLAAEVSVARLPKVHEELCGDATQVLKKDGTTMVVLSDGLGSGVKANILATLTTRIATGLLDRGVDIDTVMETVADTLPTCKVRGLAYATLAVLQIDPTGQLHLYEYDSPEILLFRHDHLVPIERHQRMISGRRVFEADLVVQENDVLLMVSDGIIHAGVGALFDLGLGQSGLIAYLPPPCSGGLSTEQLADNVIRLAEDCYLGQPGDDCTAVVVRIHRPQVVTLLTGPALALEDDEQMVRDFLSTPESTRIICGGTTAQIVSRFLDESIDTSLDYPDPRVPPVAVMRGIDLTTEGVLTLNRCYEILRSVAEGDEFPTTTDGATLVAKRLWNADEIHFVVGRGLNPAQAHLEQLVHLAPRTHVVDKLCRLIERRHIKTSVKYY